MIDLQLLQGGPHHILLRQPLAHPIHHLDHQISYVPWQLPLQLLRYLPGLVHPRDLYVTNTHTYCMANGAQWIANVSDQCVLNVWSKLCIISYLGDCVLSLLSEQC